MSEPQPQWRNFASRWRDLPGLIGGLALSAVIVGGLLLLLELPVRITDPVTGEPVASQVPLPATSPRPGPTRIPVHASDTSHVEVVRQQLIDQHVRPMFDQLSADLVPANERVAMWRKIAPALEPGINRLAATVANTGRTSAWPRLQVGSLVLDIGSFEYPEVQLDQLNMQLLELVFQSIEGTTEGAIVDDLLVESRRIARTIAVQYRKEIEEKIAYPAAEKINVLREKEAVERIKGLEQALSSLQLLTNTAKEVVRGIERIEPTVKEQTEVLIKAREKKDPAAGGKATAILREQRSVIGNLHVNYQKAQTAFRSAGTKVSTMPVIDKAMEQLLQTTDTALEQNYESIKAMTNLTGEELLTAVRKTIEQSRALSDQAEKLRAAVELQLAREQADQRYEAMSKQAREAMLLAKLNEEAEKANDPSKKGEAARRRDLLVNDLNTLRSVLTQYGESLSRIVEANKGQADQANDLRNQSQEVRAKLKRALYALNERRFAEAADFYKQSVAEYLKQEDGLQAMQVKLGLKEELNPARAARWLIERMHRDSKFATAARETFETTYRTAVKDRIVKRMDEGFNRRLKAEQVDNAQSLERLHREVDTIFDTEILKATDVHDAFMRGMSAKFPPADADPAVLLKDDGVVSGEAIRAVNQQMMYTTGSIGNSAVYSTTMNEFCARAYKPAIPNPALRRLEHLVNEVRIDRRDFLGPLTLNLARPAAGGPVPPTAVSPAKIHVARELPRLTVTPGQNALAERGYKIVNAPFLPQGRITIDGRFDDWPTESFTLSPIQEGTAVGSVKADFQHARVAFTSTELLVAVEVTDTTGKIENEKPLSSFWKNDGIEVFIDPLNTKLPRRGERNTHQFVAFPFNHRDDNTSGGYEMLIQGWDTPPATKHVPIGADVFRRAAVKTLKGWNIELAIPFTLLGDARIRPGQTLGFNLQVDTGSEMYYYLNAQKKVTPSTHPEVWGELVLLGTDGTIGLPDGPAIIPGRPLNLRVTDADMNRDDTVRDSLNVTVRDSDGIARTFSLTETGEATGVFEGSIPTRLSIGGNDPNRISLREGGQVEINYVDIARARGERYERLTLTVAVAGLGRQVGGP